MTALLSTKHYARLRQYWHAGAHGLSSTGDAIALELAAAGFLEMAKNGSRLNLRISATGVTALQVELERERARRQPHHDMAGRLAAALQAQGRITWENIELAAIHGNQRKFVRPDVFSLCKTYDEKRLAPWVHEIKVSRSDFLADLAKPEKREAYSWIAERVFYVAAAGLIQVQEVPAECGLVVETAKGVFEVLKRPKKRQVQLTPHHFMNLVLKPGGMASELLAA